MVSALSPTFDAQRKINQLKLFWGSDADIAPTVSSVRY